MALARGIGDGATAWMKTALSPDPTMRENPMALFGHFGDLLLQLLWVMLPLIGICLAAGLAGPLLMSGLHFFRQSDHARPHQAQPGQRAQAHVGQQ